MLIYSASRMHGHDPKPFFAVVPTSMSSVCHKHHDQQLSLGTSVNKGSNTTRSPTQDLLAERSAVVVVSASHSKQGLPKCLSPCLTVLHLSALWKVPYLLAADAEWHSTRAAPEQNFSPRGPGAVELALAAKEAVVFHHWYKVRKMFELRKELVTVEN